MERILDSFVYVEANSNRYNDEVGTYLVKYDRQIRQAVNELNRQYSEECETKIQINEDRDGSIANIDFLTPSQISLLEERVREITHDQNIRLVRTFQEYMTSLPHRLTEETKTINQG